MLLRAILAFLALPFMVAGIVPGLVLALDPAAPAGPAAGWSVSAAGLALLLWCVRDFYVAGKGTLAPWAPPRHLVRTGLYRVNRNPMYLAVLTIVLGAAIAGGSVWLWLYLVAVGLGFHLRVVRVEEPRLEQAFGQQWHAYRVAVPRWGLAWPPRSGGDGAL